MKLSRSLHLEEDIWSEIDKYKDKYNLSSRNAALERMLIERRMLLMMINRKSEDDDVEDLTHAKKEESKTPTPKLDPRISSDLMNTIGESYNSMPD